MEKHKLSDNIKVFGFRVDSFPNGIGEAFDRLVKELPQGDQRPYYGISYYVDGKMNYIAAAAETFDAEGRKYGYNDYVVEKGEYLAAPLTDWTTKTHCIQDVFLEILTDERVDNTKPAIEVYKNMKEMVCMVKIDPLKEIAAGLKTAADEFVQLFSSFIPEQINTVPFEGSWTAGQVVQHVNKVNKGMLRLIQGTVKPTERQPDANLELMKNQFSNPAFKMTASGPVIPENISYDKEHLIQSFQNTKAQIIKAVKTADLSETCTTFPFPVYGELTRLEAAWFILLHTQRHMHQLKNIAQKLSAST